MIRVFLDANIYFAGCVSSEGASFCVLELARRQKIKVFTSKLVLKEADRNLQQKFPGPVLKSFRRFLQETKIHIVPASEEKDYEPFAAYIHPKDAPVLAAAIRAQAGYLITLDRKHFLNPPLLAKVKKPHILTPGEFLSQVVFKGKL